MTRSIIFLVALIFGSNAFADLEIDKVVDAEIAKCQPVLDMRAVVAYGMMAEWGNFSEVTLKTKLTPDQLKIFKDTLVKVKPYIVSLAETGEVIDLRGKGGRTRSCADFAKAIVALAPLTLSPLTATNNPAERK